MLYVEDFSIVTMRRITVKQFWTNTIWYLLLDLFTLIELTVILVKSKRRKFDVAYYFTLCGTVVLFFETTVFLLLRGYDYFPMIIPDPPFDDNLLGKVFSQLSVSATALLVSVFNLKLLWILVLSGMYGLIEELFLALGIYRHNWYQTWMTVVSLIGFFWMAKKYYAKLLKGTKPVAHYFNVFVGLFPMIVLTILWAFSLSGYQRYVSDTMPSPDVYRILLANAYYVFLSVPMMLIYYYRLAWPWKLCVALLLHGVIYAAYQANVIWFANGWWYLLFSTSTILWTYYSVVLIDRFFKSILPSFTFEI